ncbi:MAG: hypothetical protein E7B11_27695 [Clostridiales bacterium]|nr:hypothetical protein [Clostridiales bacterium]MDU3244331.1 hypothetical protein [Clostridiales bacterium]
MSRIILSAVCSRKPESRVAPQIRLTDSGAGADIAVTHGIMYSIPAALGGGYDLKIQ